MRFVGHLKGGLAVTAATTCTLFGAVSGSTQATVVAVGGPSRRKMLAAGYKDSFVIALAINASDIAFLIPPSIGMIIYGVVSGTSIAELFIAGIGPGLLILVMFAAYSCSTRSATTSRRSRRRPGASGFPPTRLAIWPLGFPVIIIGGIYGGIFSPTEAASVCGRSTRCSWSSWCSARSSSPSIPDIALSTGLITAVVFILVGAGAAFSWTISFAQIPQAILGALGLNEAGPYTVLIAISIAFFVGCMFVDPIVVILILVPIFAPIVDHAGLDPVLVGTIITLQVAIGSATPPFGCDIFTAIAIFKRPVLRGDPRHAAVHSRCCSVASVLLIVFPQIALFLRDLAFR